MTPRVSVVGAGQMGINHARVISESANCQLDWVCDLDSNRAREVTKRYGGKSTADFDQVLESDAIVIATPTQLHFSQAIRALEARIPALIEKPLSTELSEVRAILDLAIQQNVKISCGFVERFNPVISAAVNALDEPVTHITVMRHSPATPRASTGVVEDLMIHDIDLLSSFSNEEFNVIGAATRDNQATQHHDIAEAVLSSLGKTVVSLSASRSGQRKIRAWNIATQNQVLELDLLRQTITQYRHVEEAVGPGGAPSYREKTIIDYPFIRRSNEPLASQLEEFLRQTETGTTSLSEIDRVYRAHKIMAEISAIAPK